MTETKSKRRWFRFSLRTLFVVTTIIGVCAGWVLYQLNWIRQRHDFTARYSWIGWAWRPDVEPPDAPLSLRLFGETRMTAIRTPESLAEHAHELFPESVICAFPDGDEGNLKPYYTTSYSPPLHWLKH
jgi:hypothetical protein